MKPRLALRSINDSRRANPLAYLSLRYTLLASTARKDRWAEEIATELIFRRKADTFLTCYQFKQLFKKQKRYRTIHLPGGSENLAEAALLAECAEHKKVFQPSECVYSYRLPSRNSADGVFEPYFELYCKRQEAIAKACHKHPEYIVLDADIKNFYPQITPIRAKRVWRQACKAAKLKPHWQNVGNRLLTNQLKACGKTCVGPQFSHLIANLLLKDLDKQLIKAFPGRYFRYVDDIVLIIPKKTSRSALASIRKPLNSLRLKLNPKKIHKSPVSDWLAHAPVIATDYDEGTDAKDVGWMHLIDHLKCYLMARPSDVSTIQSQFKSCEFRIPLPRYQAAIQDANYTARFAQRTQLRGFIASVKCISPSSLLNEALALRKHYIEEFANAWKQYISVDPRYKKWSLSKVRYLAGRLLLMASEAELANLTKTLTSSIETKEYAEMFRALSTRDVSELVTYGGKICAAVGQAIAASENSVKCFPRRWTKQVIDGYVSLLLVGCKVQGTPSPLAKKKPEIQFVSENRQRWAWRSMPDGFFRELFALSDRYSLKEHQNLLKEPFDPDEEWSFFADELVRGWDS